MRSYLLFKQQVLNWNCHSYSLVQAGKGSGYNGTVTCNRIDMRADSAGTVGGDAYQTVALCRTGAHKSNDWRTFFILFKCIRKLHGDSRANQSCYCSSLRFARNTRRYFVGDHSNVYIIRRGDLRGFFLGVLRSIYQDCCPPKKKRVFLYLSLTSLYLKWYIRFRCHKRPITWLQKNF